MQNTNTWKFQHLHYMHNTNIVAAFQGMHVSLAKHSYAWLPRKCDYWTYRRRTDRQTPDKMIPMCRYASQATQKPEVLRLPIEQFNSSVNCIIPLPYQRSAEFGLTTLPWSTLLHAASTSVPQSLQWPSLPPCKAPSQSYRYSVKK